MPDESHRSYTYNYTMAGTAAKEQTWTTTGLVTAEAGDFPLVIDTAMRETFGSLTKGRAVFGKPGMGCSGPYQITKLLIEIQSS